MMILIAIAVCLGAPHWGGAEAVSLRGDFPRYHAPAMLETGQTKWQSTSAPLSDGGAASNAKRELQELKDAVDFQMAKFIKTIDEKLGVAKEGLSAAELESLVALHEKIVDKVRDIQATIKSKCDGLAEEVQEKEGDDVHAGDLAMVRDAKKRIEQFVNDGLEALGASLGELTKESSASAKSQPKKTEKQAGDAGGRANGDDDNAGSAEDKRNESDADAAPVRNGQSLVEMGRGGAGVEPVSDKAADQGKEKKIANSDDGTRSNNSRNGGVADGSKGGDGDHPTRGGKSAAATADGKAAEKRTSPQKTRKGVDISRRASKGRSTGYKSPERQAGGETGRINENRNIHTSTADAAGGGTPDSGETSSSTHPTAHTSTKGEETGQADDLAKAPPTAVTRAVKAYLDDLSAESSKLIDKIRL